tara:strand:- start:120 stop:911 length:792 start_codon:yes stop_codon:yes gene_type:complete
MPQGSFGRVKAWNDYTSIPAVTAAGSVPLAQGSILGGGWAAHGVNEGAIDAVVDEPNGIVALTSDTADDDNIFISAGTWSPINGGMVMEARIRIVDSVAVDRAAAWVGFTETLSIATPVMPFETDTTTTTYNGSGGMVGFGFDSAADVVGWRFAGGDGGAALATEDSNGTVGTALGILAPATITADLFWVFRIEVATDGTARGYFGDAQNNEQGSMQYVGKVTGALGTGDQFHATTGIENRSGANEILEVDYTSAEGFRDWDA